MGNSLCSDITPVDRAVLLSVPPQKSTYISRTFFCHVSLSWLHTNALVSTENAAGEKKSHPNPVIQYQQSTSLWDLVAVLSLLLSHRHPWQEAQKKSPMSIGTNRAPCSITCYTQQLMHVRKRSQEREDWPLCRHTSWTPFQQQVHACVWMKGMEREKAQGRKCCLQALVLSVALLGSS